jgi:release factor glutamine methyltransferase
MRIDEWLRDAANKLQAAHIPSHRLDAELLLCEVLGKGRPYLHAHNDDLLTEPQLKRANGYLKRRQQRTPIAYILGHKEFYGRNFAVNPYTLIPRPETESVIELIEELDLPPDARIADVGTGSGAIAITLKLNQPERQVVATDISTEALAVAQQNAQTLGADIIFLQGDLAKPLRGEFDVIIANLPYVDPEWERSPETQFEPSLALFADDGGLKLISELIAQAPKHLKPHGHLLLEADPEQHERIVAAAHKHSLQLVKTEGYGILLTLS